MTQPASAGEDQIQPHGIQAEGTSTDTGGRITGLDLARALAIIGMLMVHVGPTGAEELSGWLYGLPHGRASILFGLLAGVGVSLLSASATSTLKDVRRRLAWRGAVLLPMGLLLQDLDHGVHVILQTYAMLFLLGTVAVALSDRWLLGLTAAFGVLGPLGFLTGQIFAPAIFVRASVSITQSVGEIFHGLLLSGPYPLITWVAPFLLGVWLGRLDLRALALRRALIFGGGTAALLAFILSRSLTALIGEPVGPVGWDQVIISTAHSQMPLWLAGAVGSAGLVLGAALIVADVFGHWLWPLVAAGQLSLSIYVGHLLALHWWHRALTSDDVGEAALIVLAITAIAVTLSVAWRAVLPRGPLEAMLWMLTRDKRDKSARRLQPRAQS